MNHKRGTRARIGDLAIARFDSDEVVCLVTGAHNYNGHRECEFVYWSKKGNRTEMNMDGLPPNRVIRVKPYKRWDGVLASLALDDVTIV